jgi:hypothetical protein
MNYSQIAAPVVAVVALLVSFLAWRTSLKTLRTSYRPLVRPVPLGKKDEHPFGLNPTKLALKNYGRGAAFRVMIYEDRATFKNATPIAIHDVVEPLGAGGTEQERIGRIEKPLSTPLQLNHRYRLLYQDLEGVFHETEMTVRTSGFDVKFRGALPSWRAHEAIPDNARQLAMLVERE